MQDFDLWFRYKTGENRVEDWLAAGSCGDRRPRVTQTSIGPPLPSYIIALNFQHGKFHGEDLIHVKVMYLDAHVVPIDPYRANYIQQG
jgi:hypothetical protein